MRKALRKPANNAAWTTYKFCLTVKWGKTYKDEDSIHLLKPFFLALAVDDLHSYQSFQSSWRRRGSLHTFIIVFPGSLEGLRFLWVIQKRR